MKKETEKIEIPFGAKDSELYKFEYTIPEGMEAIIDGNKVIIRKKESDDERIRKSLVKYFRKFKPKDMWDEMFSFGDVLFYLEKQKEQNPAEWSEEDENRFRNLIYLVEQSNEGKGTKEGFVKFINRLKSLRPQPHWKPSEEQMCELNWASKLSPVLESLYNELKKLL